VRGIGQERKSGVYMQIGPIFLIPRVMHQQPCAAPGLIASIAIDIDSRVQETFGPIITSPGVYLGRRRGGGGR
jgi:hypothetical protein